MTRGKVVLVPFPFDDFSGTKLRPAVCLTRKRKIGTFVQNVHDIANGTEGTNRGVPINL